MTFADRKHVWPMTQGGIDLFNKTVPIGTAVIVVLDSGEQERTNTRSHAWLCSDSGVVLLDGIAGGYSIDRILIEGKPWRDQTNDRA